MKALFELIGIITVGVSSAFSLMWIGAGIKEIMSSIIYWYERKHRFYKKPTAKCYCIDCTYYENGYVPKGWCAMYDKCMRDDHFCSVGVPRKHRKKGD